MAKEDDLTKTIEASYKSNGFGGFNASTLYTLRGINAAGGPLPLPPNTDNQGLVFFTKPELNLSYDNIISIRRLSFLADPRPDSIGNYIRCLLSPTGYDPDGDRHRSAIIDDKCAFMPISNLLVSLSAPQDISANTYTSPEGYTKEQVSWVDDKPGVWSAYNLDATFANIEGDLMGAILSTWVEYQQRTCDGSMYPFTRNAVENRIDAQTRIYRLIMDRSGKFVQNIYAPIAAYPTDDAIGAKFGYALGEHLNQANKEIRTSFRCIGAIYNDPLLVHHFNKVVIKFNPNMADRLRGSTMVKVSDTVKRDVTLKRLFNCRMYPRIADTMELEWYVDKTEYNATIDFIDKLYKS